MSVSLVLDFGTGLLLFAWRCGWIFSALLSVHFLLNTTFSQLHMVFSTHGILATSSCVDMIYI